MHPATAVVALGRPLKTKGAAVNPPITLTSTYVGTEGVTPEERVYARFSNASWEPLEYAIAVLEKSDYPALAYASGMAAVSAGSSASAEDVEHAMELMSSLGKAITVPEAYQDAVTAISGSGPAYLFFVVEAMIDAGVLLGLPRDISSILVNQTVYGSAKLLVESGQHPTVLREQVTSPGGTTAAALRQLEDHKVKAAFLTAIEAARDRSRELAGPA